MAVPTAPQPFGPSSLGILDRLDVQALQVALQEALSRAGYWQVRNLILKRDGDVITISGRVPTYYLKQLVQNIALASPGVERVNNDVHVC